MKEQGNNQQKLMELVVGKVLRKHGVLNNKNSLDSEEKEKISEIVTNIKSDVEQFLENAQKPKTENDFPELNGVEHEVQAPIQKVKKNRVFNSYNDLNTVKKFL